MCEEMEEVNEIKEKGVNITLYAKNNIINYTNVGLIWSSKDFVRFITEDGMHIRYSGDYLIESKYTKKMKRKGR